MCLNLLMLQYNYITRDEIITTPFLHLRYHGTDCALMCSADPCDEGVSSAGCKYGDFERAFTNK